MLCGSLVEGFDQQDMKLQGASQVPQIAGVPPPPSWSPRDASPNFASPDIDAIRFILREEMRTLLSNIREDNRNLRYDFEVNRRQVMEELGKRSSPGPWDDMGKAPQIISHGNGVPDLSEDRLVEQSIAKDVQEKKLQSQVEQKQHVQDINRQASPNAGSGIMMPMGEISTPSINDKAKQQGGGTMKYDEKELEEMGLSTGGGSKSESLRTRKIKSQVSTVAKMDPTHKVMKKFFHYVFMLSDIEEPVREGQLAKVIDSNWFNNICTVMIMLNGFFICWTTDRKMSELGTGVPLWEETINVCFVIFFSVELGLKVAVHRFFFFFFSDDWGWNLFDLIVVFVSFCDTMLTLINVNDEQNGDSSAAVWRILRLARVGKSLRVLRAVRFIGPLRLMLACVIETIPALFWALVLMGFVICMFGIYFVQSFADYLVEDNPSPAEWEFFEDHFGTVARSMVALFKVTSGGEDWGPFLELIGKTGELNSAMFLFFILFFMISVWNIVTSIFVDKAMHLALPDPTEAIAIQKDIDLTDAYELEMLVRKSIDVYEGDEIEEADLKSFMANDDIGTWFSARGLDVSDTNVYNPSIQTFVDMISAKDKSSSPDKVTVNGFLEAAMQMKGGALSIDVHVLSYELLRAHTAIMDKLSSFDTSPLMEQVNRNIQKNALV